MANSKILGLTAHEAAEEYCLHWTWWGYIAAWRNDSASDIEREEKRKAISDELKEMLCLTFEPQEETASTDFDQAGTRKNKILGSGNLPTQRGKARETPVFAGLHNREPSLLDDICYLRVDAQGAWTLEEREGALLGRAGPYSVKARFIITRGDNVNRKDYATCELTVILEVPEAPEDNGNGGSLVKRAPIMKIKTGLWKSHATGIKKVLLDDFRRRTDVRGGADAASASG
jgi:hypothetical protein